MFYFYLLWLMQTRCISKRKKMKKIWHDSNINVRLLPFCVEFLVSNNVALWIPTWHLLNHNKRVSFAVSFNYLTIKIFLWRTQNLINAILGSEIHLDMHILFLLLFWRICSIFDYARVKKNKLMWNLFTSLLIG